MSGCLGMGLAAREGWVTREHEDILGSGGCLLIWVHGVLRVHVCQNSSGCTSDCVLAMSQQSCKKNDNLSMMVSGGRQRDKHGRNPFLMMLICYINEKQRGQHGKQNERASNCSPQHQCLLPSASGAAAALAALPCMKLAPRAPAVPGALRAACTLLGCQLGCHVLQAPWARPYISSTCCSLWISSCQKFIFYEWPKQHLIFWHRGLCVINAELRVGLIWLVHSLNARGDIFSMLSTS